MAPRLVVLSLLVVGLGTLGACGKAIGDACSLSSDCSPNGDRICDPAPTSPNGYCTILGCDYSTCPEDSVCVQFFTGNFSNLSCDHTMPTTSGCSLDELCALDDHCVPRSSEVRYCMKTCGADSECRDGYECRNLDKMKAHGGQPVLAPIIVDGQQVQAPVDDHAPNFCAAAPKTSS